MKPTSSKSKPSSSTKDPNKPTSSSTTSSTSKPTSKQTSTGGRSKLNYSLYPTTFTYTLIQNYYLSKYLLYLIRST